MKKLYKTSRESEGRMDEDSDEEDARMAIAESRGIIPERGGFNQARVVNPQPMSVGRDIKARIDNMNVKDTRKFIIKGEILIEKVY